VLLPAITVATAMQKRLLGTVVTGGWYTTTWHAHVLFRSHIRFRSLLIVTIARNLCYNWNFSSTRSLSYCANNKKQSVRGLYSLLLKSLYVMIERKVVRYDSVWLKPIYDIYFDHSWVPRCRIQTILYLCHLYV
jgi:hypothetical protein